MIKFLSLRYIRHPTKCHLTDCTEERQKRRNNVTEVQILAVLYLVDLSQNRIISEFTAKLFGILKNVPEVDSVGL